MGLSEYVIDEGKEQEFTFKGQTYVAYTRTYNSGDIDMVVNFKNDEGFDVDGEVDEYAWELFESLGLI